jgi:hypothetical protein
MPTLNFQINQVFFLSMDKRSSRAPEGGFLLLTAKNIEATFITEVLQEVTNVGHSLGGREGVGKKKFVLRERSWQCPCDHDPAVTLR